MIIVIRYILVLIHIITLTGCATSNKDTAKSDTDLYKIVKNNNVQDYAWVAIAPEYDGMAIQVYNSAWKQLDKRLQSYDSAMYSSIRKIDKTVSNTPKPAIVVDLDETIISSIELQKQLHANGKFNDEMLVNWMQKSTATAIPGAVDFLQKASQKGVTIFYVSNRRVTLETATRLNLSRLGFPLSEDEDTVLMRYEQKNWSDDKTSRWLFIEENYRIIMQFGDSLNDFIDAKKLTISESDQSLIEYQDYWGEKWFLLPNPLYGGWEKLLDK